MNNRRDFLRKSVLAASGVLVVTPFLAETKGQRTYKFPGIIYTKKNQGMWVGLASIHIPEIKVKGDEVTMFTHHPMTPSHYIVRHTLVDEIGVVVGSKTFMPSDPKAISTHRLPSGYQGKLYATSFCNRHDLWLKEFKV